MTNPWIEDLRSWLRDGKEPHFSSRDGHSTCTWFVDLFRQDGEPDEAIEVVREQLRAAVSKRDKDAFLRALDQAAGFGSYALWDLLVEMYTSIREWEWSSQRSDFQPDSWCLLALSRIEYSAEDRREAHQPISLPFWLDQIRKGEYPSLGFAGLRNHSILHAIEHLDLLLDLGDENEQLRRTLRGIRRDAQRQGIDLVFALKAVFECHPIHMEHHGELLAATLGHETIRAVRASLHND